MVLISDAIYWTKENLHQNAEIHYLVSLRVKVYILYRSFGQICKLTGTLNTNEATTCQLNILEPSIKRTKHRTI